MNIVIVLSALTVAALVTACVLSPKPAAPAAANAAPAAQTAQPKVDKSKAITTKSGLKYVDIVEGTGPMPQYGQAVTVHYTGRLADGTKFDSSLDRNQPFTFVIGTGQVIKGWDEGVATMKTGGKRLLIIPPHLGYGERGFSNVIPPNSELDFDVELLNVR